MLQQMSSPHTALVGEAATIARPPEGRYGDDVPSDVFLELTDDSELPECKIKRNYNCTNCTYYTQNPRAYLVHTRDVHFGRFKIYDCPHCVYASKHHQKLVRHVTMVHGSTAPPASSARAEPDRPCSAPRAFAEPERIEDLLEEVEECDDIELDGEEYNYFERQDDTEMEEMRNTDRLEDRGSVVGQQKAKGKFFSCDKCNYVTHIRARYTKHVKYHSMPMIKCTMCDFRTPYKWNLDRHMKNHGGTGSFVCSKCTFTADIKQSLTVHEMNHHTPPVGQSPANRRRNRVGASDLMSGDASPALPKEEEGSGDSRSSHSASDMGLQYAEKDLINCNSDSNDASSSEIGANEANSQLPREYSQQRSTNVAYETKMEKQSRKVPRPIPQLIPLNASTPNQNKSTSGEPPAKKIKDCSNDSTDTNCASKFQNLSDEITVVPVNSTPVVAKEPTRKKNESFFDRLKERLLTETGENGSLTCKNCGFESKCLSEHSVHEKNCTTQSTRIMSNASMSSGSTRCQNCRHRCKSSADLYIHMQTCTKQNSLEGDKLTQMRNQDSNEGTSSSHEKEVEPHPMENVVFVWNNINQIPNKFNSPLGININEDNSLSENHDIVDESEEMNMSPNSLAVGKHVFKCPDCKFWAATASRFHVHIVGHLNKKPFECSVCKYKSNWRWDITKHIKLKSARDPEHNDAKVHMTDETGRRNYSKYNKFLALRVYHENSEDEFHYIDPNTTADTSMEVDDTFPDMNESPCTSLSGELQPLNLQTYPIRHNMEEDSKKPKKTLWKCKKCNYKDPSKEALLEHVREHSRQDGNIDDSSMQFKKFETLPDPSDLAYRCGHCNQLSNWKHVIQRHCRLKHDGIIKVITTVKPKPDTMLTGADMTGDTCPKCPFQASDKKFLIDHLQQHQPSSQSIFKCYFCPFFVKDEPELIQHLVLHGVNEPEDYIAKAKGCKSPLPDTQTQYNGPLPPLPQHQTKRYKCAECPYVTNSKAQFKYHEQFHQRPADSPYKCPECNYSVSKRHLLHQHLRVHGIVTRKPDSDAEFDAKSDSKEDISMDVDEIPHVWVSAKDEFHKMFKCRYCSYVNIQKSKIPVHEKIHCLLVDNSEQTVYKCLECKFTGDQASVLAKHSKKHGLLYGRIYGFVEPGVSDDEQVAKLRKMIELDKSSSNSEDLANEDVTAKDNCDFLKIMYFCQKCPARYFSESDLKVHKKFHDLTLANKCNLCEFSVPDENEIASHILVHSDEYNTKTNMLKFMHSIHPLNHEPRVESVTSPETSEITWVVSLNKVEHVIKKYQHLRQTPKQYRCKECPAKFFKSSALNYHAGLHGGDGEHKCKKCSYAVKNIGNLAKHEALHETETKTSGCDYQSGDDFDYTNIPLSGTDLFQRKTEAQKRVLTDKDKLVKPNDHFPPVLHADPQFGYLMHGNPEFIYPTYLKNGRQKEKRYKCHKCPSAFEKREQYKIHLSLHGSKQRYKCELCDYSVKYYANYVQHMRKHQMNDDAHAERMKTNDSTELETQDDIKLETSDDNIKLAIKTMPKATPKTDFQQFSIRDQQTLRLLQRRRSTTNAANDTVTETPPTKERKMHMCLLCPYTNQRQDALSNHYKRHDNIDVSIAGNHKCSFCDLAVVQSHFLREHLKSHFNYHKTLTPECFVANEDVTFTFAKVDEDGEATDLKLDTQTSFLSHQEKILVKMSTGELMVE